jgi:hypothetical protein
MAELCLNPGELRTAFERDAFERIPEGMEGALTTALPDPRNTRARHRSVQLLQHSRPV